MGIIYRDFISPEGISNLKFYKYQCIDKSLVAKYIGQPFWNGLVNFIPLYVAPNLITLTGLILMIMGYCVVAYHSPYIHGNPPGWVFVIASVTTFLYQTLDALDGKQARRTATSSPLGELFDHGCDAITTGMLSLSLSAAFEVGAGYTLLILIFLGFLVFYCAQWEEYHCKIMMMGHLGVTEILLMSEGIYMWTAYAGTRWWTDTVFYAISFGEYEIPITPKLFMVLLIGGGSLSTALNSYFSILVYYFNKKYKKGGLSEKAKRRQSQIYKQIAPLILMMVLMIAWTIISDKISYSSLLQTHPHGFLLTSSFIFAYNAGRIVVARVCKEELPMSFNVLIILLIAIINSLFKEILVEDEVMVYIVMTLAILIYLHFALNVIRQMCGALNISCLTIPYPMARKGFHPVVSGSTPVMIKKD